MICLFVYLFIYCLSLSAGCELGFTDEANDNSLPFFPSGSALENFIDVPANQNCSFYFGNQLHVNYLRCDGTWKSQSLSSVIEVTSGWSIRQLSIKVSGIDIACTTHFSPSIQKSFKDLLVMLKLSVAVTAFLDKTSPHGNQILTCSTKLILHILTDHPSSFSLFEQHCKPVPFSFPFKSYF